MDLPLSLRALALALLLVAPVAASLPASTPGGILVVGPDTIGAGVTREYRNGTFLVLGDVVVEDGGTLVFDRADIVFVAGAWVITVEPGGRFVSSESTLRPDPTANVTEALRPGVVDRRFRVELEPGAVVDLVDTVVSDSEGVVLASSLSTVENVTFLRNENALTLQGVDLSLAGLAFQDNLVGLTAVGGAVTITGSRFVNNTHHIVGQGADMTLLDSEVLGGLRGFRSTEGSADLRRNSFVEHLGPDTIGIWITDAESVHLEGNSVRDWEQGIRIDDSPATLAHNEIAWTGDCCVRQVAIGGSGGLHFHNSSVEGGSVYADAAEGASLVFENSSFDRADLHTGWGPTYVRHNSFQGSGLFAHVGTIHDNLVRQASHGISVWDGPAIVVDNVVDEADHCYRLANSFSARNEARNCGVGFSLSWGTVSEDDEVLLPHEGYAVASTRAFHLHGSGGELRRASAIGYGTGLQVEGSEGGWRVSNASFHQNVVGVEVRPDTKNVTLRDVAVTESLTDGLRALGGAVYTDHTRVQWSLGHGIYVADATVTGSQNWIASNELSGVTLGADGFATLTNSYWGSPTGPTVASNPGGTGDAVSPGVVYAPFLTSPP